VSKRYTLRWDGKPSLFSGWIQLDGKDWAYVGIAEQAERIAAALNAQDNPELDDTPHESAAYARGRDAGFNAAVREVNKILDGKDSGTGVCSAEWQPTRERLLTQAVVVEALRSLEIEIEKLDDATERDSTPEMVGATWRLIKAARAAIAAVKEKDRG
jgi:hypothetical protein